MRYTLALLLGLGSALGFAQSQDRSNYFIDVRDYYLTRTTWRQVVDEIKADKLRLNYILLRGGQGAANYKQTILEFHAREGRIVYSGPELTTGELLSLRELCRCPIYTDRETTYNVRTSPYREWQPGNSFNGIRSAGYQGWPSSIGIRPLRYEEWRP